MHSPAAEAILASISFTIFTNYIASTQFPHIPSIEFYPSSFPILKKFGKCTLIYTCHYIVQSICLPPHCLSVIGQPRSASTEKYNAIFRSRCRSVVHFFFFCPFLFLFSFWSHSVSSHHVPSSDHRLCVYLLLPPSVSVFVCIHLGFIGYK